MQHFHSIPPERTLLDLMLRITECNSKLILILYFHNYFVLGIQPPRNGGEAINYTYFKPHDCKLAKIVSYLIMSFLYSCL